MNGRMGEGDRCPLCGATGGVSSDSEGGYRCLVCGAPRIVLTEAVQREGGERSLLENVKSLRAKRAAWAVASSVIGAFGAIAALIALLVFWLVELGIFATAALIGMTLAPLVLAIYGWRRARDCSERARADLDEARRVVAAEVIAARPGRTEPKDLARLLAISEDEALELHAHAEISGLVGEPAAARYRVETILDAEDHAAAPPERADKVVR